MRGEKKRSLFVQLNFHVLPAAAGIDLPTLQWVLSVLCSAAVSAAGEYHWLQLLHPCPANHHRGATNLLPSNNSDQAGNQGEDWIFEASSW